MIDLLKQLGAFGIAVAALAWLLKKVIAHWLGKDERDAEDLTVLGKAFGATAHVLPGNGLFETSTEILEPTGRTDQIGVAVGTGDDCVLPTWITLTP